MTARILALPPLLLALAACDQMPDFLQSGPAADPGATAGATASAEPPPEEIAAVVSAPPPPASARTAAEFDTTTDEQKAAAQAAPTGGEQRLGTTVVSLGDPTEPGIWIRTPLVKTAGSGRVETEAGASGVVQLLPLDGPASAGSQMSIAAFQLLGLGLTDLATVTVYAG
jgi:hypothetical protein